MKTEERLLTKQPLLGKILALLIILLPFFLSSTEVFAQETATELIEALQKKKTSLEEREQNVALEESRLKVLKAEVRSMLDEYGKLKEIVDLRESEHTKKLKADAEKRMLRLAKIYQAMPPKEAATRMSKMSQKTALKLLRKIKEKKAAKILSNMSVERATRFSEDYAKTER